jgi:hypothetical protein
VKTALSIIAVLIIGCEKAVESDSRPPFTLDPSKPFVIEFGRGSGLRGLDIVKIDQTGTVTLSRIAGGRQVESASLEFSSEELAAVVRLVNSNQLTRMGRAYSDSRIHDGTQCILWIAQTTSEKSVYFDNSFPSSIAAFAKGLDDLLQNAGLNNTKWNPMPHQEGANQQTALWGRIRG